MSEEIVKLKNNKDVGETPFQFIARTESILQGWDKTIKRTVFLFKTNEGNWGYYDKATGRVIDANQWQGKSTVIDGRWVKMELYHRVHLFFAYPIQYTERNKTTGQLLTLTTHEAIVTITDDTWKKLQEQLNGRPPESYLKFGFTTRKMGTRMSTYIDRVSWVPPHELAPQTA